jgi:hypothetical protein
MPPRAGRHQRRSTPTPAAPTGPARGTTVLLGVAIVLLVAFVYAPVRGYDFVNFDDGVIVSANPHVTGGLSWSNVRWAFANTYVGSGGPLTWMSHMLDIQLFGLDPGRHHAVNVALHACNAMLLLVVLSRMTGALWRSACVAVLFAVHPLNVETVAWIAQRKDMLSTLLLLSTMWAYACEAAGRPPLHVRLDVLYAGPARQADAGHTADPPVAVGRVAAPTLRVLHARRGSPRA